MFKITNKTNQTFIITGVGYLKPYETIEVKVITDQLRSMAKKNLIIIK